MSERATAEVAEKTNLIFGVVDAGDESVLVRRTTTGLLDILAHGIIKTKERVALDAGHERITTHLAPRHIAAQLQITPADPVFLLERRATAQGRPAEWRETHIRGDHFSLETDWSPTTSSMTALTAPSDIDAS